MSKNASEPFSAKQLISNLFLVAYKLFLYKILINDGIEAHRNDGSVAWGVLKIGHLGRKAGRQQRTNYYQSIKILNQHLMC